MMSPRTKAVIDGANDSIRALDNVKHRMEILLGKELPCYFIGRDGRSQNIELGTSVYSTKPYSQEPKQA